MSSKNCKGHSAAYVLGLPFGPTGRLCETASEPVEDSTPSESRRFAVYRNQQKAGGQYYARH